MARIVHLGIGNFHRAHQAWYTHIANQMQSKSAEWKITGVSLRSARIRDAMRPGNFSYSLLVQGNEAIDRHRISVHDTIIVAPEDPLAVIEAIANAETKIVTLTITEKGYHQDPQSGALLLDADDLRHDLVSATPCTAIGLLAYSLKRRRDIRGGPLTVISCDNLSDNGHRLSSGVSEFSDAAGLAISDYISSEVTFPATMVDRITPAVQENELHRLAHEPGPSGGPFVLTEAFSEWIIEDRFAGDYPRWTDAGAQIVSSVFPFEARKLHLLNAAHSYLAYSGMLRGYTYVHEAIGDLRLRQDVIGLFYEASKILPVSIPGSLAAYKAALLERFRQPGMKHALGQIAMDGSQKIPVRIVPVLRDLQRRGEASPHTTKVLAAWIACLWRAFEAGESISDPEAPVLAQTFAEAQSNAQFCRDISSRIGLHNMPDAWHSDLAQAAASLRNT